MKKILLAFGTRPEAIKMCPLARELTRRGVTVRVCVSGQHKELLTRALADFGIKPDRNLRVMRAGASLGQLTARILTRTEKLLRRERPDAVLVHGDTTTTLATAMAAFYGRVPLGHVEAGLRTYRMNSPFPEEYNRRTVALTAKWHFVPTEGARANLLREGIADRNIFVTGNTGIDALAYTVRADFRHPLLAAAEGKRLLLLTAHRRENQGALLARILRGVRRALDARDDLFLVCPTHPSPAARAAVQKALGGHPCVALTAPLDTVTFHNLMARATLLLTDSGGIQEEAAALHIPTLVLRECTERPEGLSTGALRLAGTDEEAVYQSILSLLDDPAALAAMRAAKNPYGDGRAAVRIADALLAVL